MMICCIIFYNIYLAEPIFRTLATLNKLSWPSDCAKEILSMIRIVPCKVVFQEILLFLKINVWMDFCLENSWENFA